MEKPFSFSKPKSRAIGSGAKKTSRIAALIAMFLVLMGSYAAMLACWSPPMMPQRWRPSCAISPF